jgi:hypothetical protein
MFHNLFGLVRQGPPPRPRRARPAVEALEPRYAPAVTVSVVSRVLTVQCDSGANAVTVDYSSGFTVINGAAYSVAGHDSIRINGGAGGLTTNIRANVKPLALFGAHDGDAVNIGDTANTVQRILAPLDIENPPLYNVVTINDQGDSTARTGAVDVGTIGGSNYEKVTGLGAAEMDFKVADTRSVTLRTGTGGATVSVHATAAFPGGGGTTVEGHSLNTTVIVGNSNTLSNILGPLAITNPPSYTHVTVNDSADNGNHPNVVLTPTSLTGLAPATITFGPDDLSRLDISVGNGTNTYTVTNTQYSGVSGGNTTTLNAGTGGGTDVVNVQAASAVLIVNLNAAATSVVNLGYNNSIAGINADVWLNVQHAYSLNVNDSADTASHPNVILYYSYLAGLSTGTIHFNITVNSNTIVINGGSGTNHYQMAYIGPTGAVTLNTGSGNDTVEVVGTTGPLAVNGGGGNDTLLSTAAGHTTLAISGADAGTLSGSSYHSAGGVPFSQIPNLRSQYVSNTFSFADGATLSGNLTGTGGDALDDRAYSSSVVVDLQTGLATGVGGVVSGIGTVFGGTGNGTSGAYNLLLGTGGTALYGGLGRRNVLVAGGPNGTLTGGDQDDLLVAGYTAYDTEAGLASWQAIAAYWAGSDDFATRAYNLTTGSGVPLLDATTVTGTGNTGSSGNVLNGSGELALVYTDFADTINGPFDPNSQYVPVAP